MYKVVYTKSLDNADDIISESWEYTDLELAKTLFKERVYNIVNEILANEFFKAKISIHNFKALIKIESVHHCLAIVDDMNKGI